MESPLAVQPLWQMGFVVLMPQVLVTWGLMAGLFVLAWLIGRHLAERPDRGQTALEGLVETIETQLRDIFGREPRPFMPLLATLFVFIAVANLSGLLPGVAPPTERLETPAALAAVVFGAVQYFGVRERGVIGYLKGFASPNPLLLPLHLIGEFTRVFSLMVRLFGNMMSHGFIIAILLSLAGLFAPIPFMALGILIGLVQAYIFTILAAVYIAAAISSHDQEPAEKEEVKT